VLDPGLVREAVAGVDVIIVTLSMVRSNPNNPWSRITTPMDLHPRAAELLTSSASPGTRYVSLSAHGVGQSREKAGWLFMGLVDVSNIGVAYRALAQAEKVITASDLPWTVVRPTRLTNGAGTGCWRWTDNVLSSRASIHRQDVAAALVSLSEGRECLQRTVSLTCK
jgi:putative NADH-flavin reductase